MAEAEELYRKALDIRRKKLPPDSPLTAYPLLGLGKVLVDRDKPADAEPLLREALAISTSTRPKGHWRIALGPSVLGECLTALGMFEEAEDLLLRSHDELVGSRGKDNLQTIAARERIIALFTKWNNPKEADAWRDASQAP